MMSVDGQDRDGRLKSIKVFEVSETSSLSCLQFTLCNLVTYVDFSSSPRKATKSA